MSVTLTWSGIEEYQLVLKAMPATCSAAATEMIGREAHDAFATIVKEYARHQHTGNLMRGLSITPIDRGDLAKGTRLQSDAPHAWLFDNGTEARHYVTEAGARHETGRMWGRSGPTHIFEGTVRATSRRIAEQLRALIEKEFGVPVTGQPDAA